MPKQAGSNQEPKSELHQQLGDELRRLRLQTGKTTRQVGKFSSTQVSRVENGLADCSEDFIHEYVKFGGDKVRLLTLLDDIRRASADHRRKQRLKGVHPVEIIDPRTMTPDSDFHELRRLYKSEELDDHYLIGANLAAIRATHIIRVRPLSQHCRYYVCSYGIGDAGRRGALTLQTGPGCEVARLTESDKGVLHFVLDFTSARKTTDEPLHEFAFTITFNHDEPMTTKPMLRNSTRSGVRRVVKRVQFTDPALPGRIWWFRNIELLETEDDPSPEQMLSLNPSNFYFREFSDLIDEYVGLAWEWSR